MIPDKIKIGGMPYKIFQTPDVFCSDTEHLGEIKYRECKININCNMPEEMKLQTLIHQWVHGELFAIGYDDLREDEKVVQNFAMQINQAFVLRQEASDD